MVITAQHLRTALDGGAYGSYGVASTYYTGRAADRHLQAAAPTSSTACAPSPTSRPAAPSAATARRSRASASRCTSTRSPSSWGSTPPTCACGMLAEPDTITANWLQIGSMGLRRCIEAVVEGSALPRALGQAARGARPGARLRLLPLRRGPADLLEPHAAVGRDAEARPLGRRRRLLRRGRDRPGLGLRSSPPWWPRCSASRSPTSASASADTDLTPVDLGSYSSRVTLMMGNAALQAAERARELIAKAVSEQLEVPVVAAGLRRAPGVRRRRTRTRGLTFQDAVIAAEARFGTLGTTGSYIPPRSPGTLPRRGRRPLPRLLLLGGGGRGRGRSRDRPLESASTSGSPTTSAVRSIPVLVHGPGRGERLHGPGRGDDGRAGLPPAAAPPLVRPGAQAPRRCSSTRARPSRTCRRSPPI